MERKVYCLYPLCTNCYLIFDGDECAVIDPASSAELIRDEIVKIGAKLKYVLLTHGHFDHIGGADKLKEYFPEAKIIIGASDAAMLSSPMINASALFGGDVVLCRSDHETVTDGDLLSLGSESIAVMSTPGHTRGSVCFICSDAVYTGDTLFDDGYGRTDLPNAAPECIGDSVSRIRRMYAGKLAFPGHGEKFII